MKKSFVPQQPVMVVDDETAVLRYLSLALESGGINNILTCDHAPDVMGMLQQNEAEVLLLDLNMPHISGQALLPGIREEYPDLPVIIVSGITEVEMAVECMKSGVFDYLVKPIEKSKLLATVGRAMEIRELRRENSSLRSHLVGGQLDHPEAFSDIVFADEQVRSILLYIESIAASAQTVLVTGETGVGKELIARAIHKVSGRSGQLVAVNVAGYDDTMFSDALFGHLKGAYTGADRARSGLIEKADSGTLFLDEIGELRPESQVKLLRLLESGEYFPLGSDVAKRSAARVVVATNRDLEEEMSRGGFRRDLYYRLYTHHVHVPPLRERMKDLPLLLQSFAHQAAEELGKAVPEIPQELPLLLQSYPFPGNVRELRAMVLDALSRSSGKTLPVSLFKNAIGQRGARPQTVKRPDMFRDVEQLPTIKESTEMLVAAALQRSGGNQSLAARMLGITPQALSQRLKRDPSGPSEL